MITQNCTNLLNTIQNDDYKEFENTIRNNAQILIFKCLIVNQNRNKTKHSTFKLKIAMNKCQQILFCRIFPITSVLHLHTVSFGKTPPFSTENSPITFVYLNNYLIVTRDRDRDCVQLSVFVSLHWCGCFRLDISYYL